MSEENSAKNNEWSNRELGALWKKEGKSQNYLSGFVKIGEFGVEQEVRLVIFTNKNKSKNPNAPDFVIYKSEDTKKPSAPEESQEAGGTPPPSKASAGDEVPELLA
jgi:hypothetical protein